MKDNFKPWQTSMSPKRIREKRGRRREKKKIVCHTLSACTRVTRGGGTGGQAGARAPPPPKHFKFFR